MGAISVTTADGTEVEFTDSLRESVLQRVRQSLDDADLSSRNTDSELLRFIK
jgi:hypothetical protein